MIAQFKVKFNFKSLNEVINESKKHWTKYSKIKEHLTNSISIQCPGLNIDYHIDIHFEWHPKNKMKDHDNIAFNKKYILDAMVKKGTITTDTQKVVCDFKDSFIYDSKEDFVIIYIFEK